MSRGRGLGRAGRVLAAAVVAAVALLPAWPATVLGADPAFGQPIAESRYGDAIEFTVPYTAGDPVDRLELRLQFPDALGPYLVDIVPPTGSGTQTLRYVLDLTADGHIVPNTSIEATWVARLANGRTVTSRRADVTHADTGRDWRTASGDVVRVHWYEGGRDFANRALAIGEEAVEETAALLGVTETEPIDFFIYADEEAFRAALGPGTRENVGGQAHSDIRTLFALITPDAIDDAWVGVVIPHELVHLVFDTAVRNPYRFPPRWLNEGLATFLSESYTGSDRRLVERAAASGDLIPLTALAGQFPTDVSKTFLAYAESASAIDHLVRTHDRDAMVSLVLAYRDGLTDDQAFRKALGQDLAAFQDDWLGELGAGEPVRYGPVPAPAGPLPSDWSGPAGSPGPAASPATRTADPGGPAATPVPSIPTAGDRDDPGAVLALVGVGGLLLAASVALVAARRRSRPT